MKITDYGKEYLNEQDKFDISIDNDFSVENKGNHTSVKTGVIDTNLMNKLIILRKDMQKRILYHHMQFFKNFL